MWEFAESANDQQRKGFFVLRTEEKSSEVLVRGTRAELWAPR